MILVVGLGATADWVTAYATVGLVVTGVVAIVFAWVQIRNERGYRRIENLENLIRQFESEPLAGQRKALASDRLTKQRESLLELDPEDPPNAAYDVLNFFEHIAFLVRKKHLAEYDVWHTFHYWASAVYYDLRTVIECEQIDDKTTFRDFLWLWPRLERIQKEQGGCDNAWVQDELVTFYKSECDGASQPIPRKRMRRKKSFVATSNN